MFVGTKNCFGNNKYLNRKVPTERGWEVKKLTRRNKRHLDLWLPQIQMPGMRLLLRNKGWPPTLLLLRSWEREGSDGDGNSSPHTSLDPKNICSHPQNPNQIEIFRPWALQPLSSSTATEHSYQQECRIGRGKENWWFSLCFGDLHEAYLCNFKLMT